MNALKKFHPLSLMTYFLCIMLISMFLQHPIISALALFGGIAYCLTLTSKQEKISDLKFYVPLFLLITVTNPLFSHNGATPLFFMNGNAVTLEAIICGANMAVMLTAVVLWCKAYSYVFTTDKFIYLFGRAIPKLSLVISTALRFVPMLKRQAKKVRKAQKAMGFYTSKSYTDRFRLSMRVYSSLVGWSLENAVETSKSMRARGYGVKGRTNYHSFKFKAADLAVILLSLLSVALVIFGSALGYLRFFYYPKISDISLSPFAIVCYAVFAAAAFLPFILETLENIRWKYYKSKI